MQRKNMTRLIEIYDNSTDEDKQLSTDDLPLQIYFSKENKLIISPINEDENKNAFAYISQDDNHIFLQPNDEIFSNKIFHNNEIINSSIWLKSGDTLQIEKKLINYIISGDRIQIIVSDVVKKPIIVPPHSNENDPNSNQSRNKKFNTIKDHSAADLKKNSKIKSVLFILIFFLLIVMSVYILLAKTVFIDIQPKPDKLSLNGFFPNIKLDKRYLVIQGEYELSAEKKDYRLLKEKIIVNEKENNFFFTMKENPGIINFNINPNENSKIYLNEELLDQDQNLFYSYKNGTYEIDKGEYMLHVTHPRYKDYTKKIIIEGKNKQQIFDIQLIPNWAVLIFETVDENINIRISSKHDKDKILYENIINGINEVELISGEYIAQLSKEKYQEQLIEFSLKAEQQLILEPFELMYKEGILEISSKPAGSIVRIDGQYLGQTPGLFKLVPYEEYDLELSLSGFQTIKQKINLEADVVLKKDIILKANKGLVFISVSPKNAKLYINGQQQKENSGKFNLTGNNVLTVKAKSYQTQTKKISVSSYSKNISFILKNNNTQNTKISSNKNSSVNTNYINSIGQKMLRVEPAIFMMGSKKNEAGRSSNEAEHKIQLSYAYLMSDKEVTNKQYRKFRKAHHSASSANQSLNLDNQPVVNISWNDAAKFANWLSNKESLTPFYIEKNGIMLPQNTNGYRLPYEAEWILAARGTTQKKYPWNGNYPPSSVVGNYADESASTHIANTIANYNDKYSVTAPVGSYIKNQRGFYDLGGNVSEWCEDYYSPTAGLSGKKIAFNPTGPDKGTHRVVRDASWRDASIREVRLSYRTYSKKKNNDIGFRLARYAK